MSNMQLAVVPAAVGISQSTIHGSSPNTRHGSGFQFGGVECLDRLTGSFGRCQVALGVADPMDQSY